MSAGERAQARLDRIAKPLRALGRLEELIVQLADIQGTEDVCISPRCALVFCGDHGVVAEGVSQSGSGVTALVASAIAEGTSNVSLMAAASGTVKMDCQPYPEPIAPQGDLKHLRDKGIHTGLWWYGDYPENVTGCPSAATEEKGEAALSAAALDLIDVIRTVKADTAAPRLQKEFYERVKTIKNLD